MIPTSCRLAKPLPSRSLIGQLAFLFPSIEIDQKLQEIMKQTGYLTVGGQVSTGGVGGGGFFGVL